jgi:hypothetical protein
MAILVDQARWPWQGTYWCHLVTDVDLQELHDFAGRLGCRRIGFQGDHYDIDVETRLHAIELGAEACDSRELVRRLRLAGLRLRPSAFTKWSLRERGDQLAKLPSDFSLFERRLGGALTSAEHYFMVERPGVDGAMAAALVLVGASPIDVVEDPTIGLFSRTDARGQWSVEMICPPPGSTE